MSIFSRIKIKFLRQRSSEGENLFLFLKDGLSLQSKDLANRRRGDWVESAFINNSDEDVARTGKNYLGLSLSNKKLVLFLLFVLTGIGLLFGRSAYLQVVKGDYYLNIAEKNRIRIFNITAPRGIIYDVNNEALVKNVPSFAVFITPYDMNFNSDQIENTKKWLYENLEEIEIKENLEKILELKQNVKEYFEPVILIDGLEYEKALAMRIDSMNYPGVNIQVTAKRQYLTYFKWQPVSSLAHVLGYQGKINPDEYEELQNSGYLLNDYIGKTGIETSYEEQFRGKYGKEQVEVDSSGKAVKIIAREEMQKGDNIFLSIDLEMQAKLEAIIQKYLWKLNKTKASAVVMNPETGKVYSLVSLPGYDNNLFAQGISQDNFDNLLKDKDRPLFNRVLSGEYPSGSVIKPVIGAAALEENVINENSSFLSVGGIRITEWFFPDWKAGGHGITNIRKAIADSVNTFFYIIGGGHGDFEGLGVYKMKEYAEKFGLSSITGIDLPNEQSGFLPTPEWKLETKKERWYIGDTYHMAIGQGDLLVTPLQVANYTSVFANNGKLMKPQIVDRYLDQESGQEVVLGSQIIRQDFIEQENINIIRQGMRQAVTNGSAKILNSLPVTSAAKTGTAQWATDKTPHSWFTAFAPYNDSELVITILVEEGGEGSAVSAPIAYEFLSWYFREYRK